MTDMYDLAGEPRPKLCINCKHIGRNGSGDAKRYRCFAPKNIEQKDLIDLVTGETSTIFNFTTCYDARAEGVKRMENCGPEGKWFEPAPTHPIIEANRREHAAVLKTAAADLLSQLDKMP